MNARTVRDKVSACRAQHTLVFRNSEVGTPMNQPAIAPSPGSVSSKKPKPRRRIDLLPFWLILPSILVLLAIQVYPIFYTLILSVQERKPAGWVFVGLKNFQRLLGSAALKESAGHTVVFLVGFVALTLSLSFYDRLAAQSQIGPVGPLHHLALHPLDPCRYHRGGGVSPARAAGLRALLRHPAAAGDLRAEWAVGPDRGCGEAVVRQLPLPAVAGHDLFDPGRDLARAALHHAPAAGRAANCPQRGHRKQPHRRRE